MQLIKFPHIDQLRHVVKEVQNRASFHNVPLPSLTFHGTPKLHGTNAAVCRDLVTGEIWCQSRETIITPEQDNAGFARFIFQNWAAVSTLLKFYSEGRDTGVISIYGEWCGKGIMKGVGITQLDKMFVIFGVKHTVFPEPLDLADANEMDAKHPGWDEPTTTWLPSNFEVHLREALPPDVRIFDIHSFPSYDIKIDFMNPEASLDELVRLTTEVEQECPVAKAFGLEKTLGEGIVWVCSQKWLEPDQVIHTDDLRFKTKGDKHKEAAHEKPTVDAAKVENIKVFVDGVATPHRFEKMVEKLRLNQLELVPTNIPQFLQLVGDDVLREEGDVLAASGLDRKDVMKQVNFVARNWFLTLCKNQPM